MSGYLEFKASGVKEVDDILSALENAGDCYHNTSQWSEKDYEGKSHIDVIQEKLDLCANKIKKLTSHNSASTEICSCSICDYCAKNEDCNSSCYGDEFEGRKLRT